MEGIDNLFVQVLPLRNMLYYLLHSLLTAYVLEILCAEEIQYFMFVGKKR